MIPAPLAGPSAAVAVGPLEAGRLTSVHRQTFRSSTDGRSIDVIVAILDQVIVTGCLAADRGCEVSNGQRRCQRLLRRPSVKAQAAFVLTDEHSAWR
jgi:hypothetical protein